jgi:hypothetical protein
MPREFATGWRAGFTGLAHSYSQDADIIAQAFL